MLRSIVLKSLRDVGRGFVWWSIGLAGFVALIVSVYPTVHSNPGLKKLVGGLSEGAAGVHRVRRAGRLRLGRRVSRDRALLAHGAAPLPRRRHRDRGAGRSPGRRSVGRSRLLLANPVSRTRVVLEKSLALALEIAGLGLVLWLALWVGALAVGMDISVGHLAAATLARRPARDRIRRDRRPRRRRERADAALAIGVTRRDRGRRLPRQRARAARRRARGAAEALALLPLRRRRPAPSRRLRFAHGGPRRDRDRRDRARAAAFARRDVST